MSASAVGERHGPGLFIKSNLHTGLHAPAPQTAAEGGGASNVMAGFSFRFSFVTIQSRECRAGEGNSYRVLTRLVQLPAPSQSFNSTGQAGMAGHT